MPAAGWVLLALGAVLLGLIYWDGLRFMVETWNKKEEYSHAFLIPFISLFLIWQKKDELQQLKLQGSWAGVVVLFLALLLYLLGELSTLFIIVQYSFLLALYGLALAFIGWRGVRLLWAPLLFLFFMIPLPNFLYQGLSAQLQLISSQLGVAVIRLFDIGVYLEGNVIDLGTYKLQVVEACSGLRYLFPLTSLAFLMAYIFKAAAWKRVVIFLSSIPITILMNSFRIGVIGILVEYWGPGQAEGFLHDFEGWVVFMASMGVLLVEMWLLTKLPGEGRSLSEAFAIDFPRATPADSEVHTRNVPRSLVAAILVCLAGLVSAVSLGERAEVIPSRADFSAFPMQLGDWTGREDRLEQIYVNALKLDDYIIADYANGTGKPVNFYVAYYGSQSKGESAHSPRSCLPGGGWRISELTQQPVDGVTVSGMPLRVNRVVIKKGDFTQLVYYWFQGRGRVITNEYMVKWFLFWDALTRSRTDGALVRLTTVVPPGGSLGESDKLLSDFATAAVGRLGRFVPE
jgi:exosortase D (VPLPA-CTERM-specific)